MSAIMYRLVALVLIIQVPSIQSWLAPSRSSSKTSLSASIYSMPALYDIAFGYRDYDEEVRFLLRQNPSSKKILELAAGPARHSLTALQQGVSSVTCLDLSPEMRDYALESADMELPVDDREHFHYVIGDMRSFSLEETFDSVWILLGSLQHLTTNADVLQCFQCAHRHLSPGGTVIIELPHPMETFSMVECTRNGWEVPLDDQDGEYGVLKVIWGDQDDEFDPITQVRQFTVAMELEGIKNNDPDLQNVKQIVPMRLFTAQEIDALATAAGFKVKAMYGALDDEIDIKNQDIAFRMVSILQKI